MGYLSVGRAVSVRLLFASHGLVSIWRLSDVTMEPRYWLLCVTLGLLFVETMVTVGKRQGKEWKWFCPSVFIYLLTSVPAIWFLELHEFDKRARYHEKLVAMAKANNQTTFNSDTPPQLSEDLNAPLGSFLGVKFEIRIPIKLTADQWIRMLEQILLLVLILGRWLLPKGKLTHDQLSQLLLVYIGTAADIVEFFEAFKEKEVRYDKVLCIVILGIWSLSLIQFSLVLTASRARRDQSGLYFSRKPPDRNQGCCRADVFGIVISIVLQDLPFLILRMLLIFKYNVLSYTNMFFTSKNTLVIVLLIYRLVVVFLERNDTHTDVDTESTATHRWTYDDNSSAADSFAGSIRSSAHLLSSGGSMQISARMLSSYPVQYKTPIARAQPRVYHLRQEKHKWGRAYHFEQVSGNL